MPSAPPKKPKQAKPVKPVELTHKKHGKLRLSREGVMQVAASQHLVSLGVAELVRAVCCFPLFLSRNPETGRLALVALTGLVPGTNLFVADGEWQAIYMPSAIQTYPLHPVAAAKGKPGWTLGIDASSPALSTEAGEPLFDESGEASIRLKQLGSLLEADVSQGPQTSAFCAALDEAQLVKPVALSVIREAGESRRFRGLSTLDELALQALPQERLLEWSRLGYLAPIHALLMSIYQLNGLIQRSNARDPSQKVKQVKLEVEKQAQ